MLNRIQVRSKTLLVAALVFGATAIAASQSPAPAPATPAKFDQWRSEMKKALFIADPLPPLSAKKYGTFTPAEGVVAERVSYGTNYGMRVPAIVYRPTRAKGRLPGMVIVNGHGGDKTSWYAFYAGILYARAGAVVVTYDPVGEDERNSDLKSATNAHDTFVPGDQMPARMGGQFVTDIMQAVSYLDARSDVDPHRIGVAAFSMGSFHAVLAGAIDPRIHALLLSGGGNLSGPGDYWARSPKVMCQSGPSKALDFLPERGALLYALNQRRGPTFIMNGTLDNVVVSVYTDEAFFAAQRERTANLSGTHARMFETYWFPGVGHRPNFVTRPAALWLNRQLHFPNWTEAAIASLPEVRVSDWATTTGAHVGASALGDAGVFALTKDIPNVPRDQLQAIPSEMWQHDKDDYTWESWVRRASAASK